MASFDHLDLFLDQWLIPADNSLSSLLDSSQTITISGSGSGSGSGFGSGPEADSNPKRTIPGPATGRVGKRKPRPSKKSSTTFITADAANFRQMVQEVTGVQLPPPTGRFGTPASIVRPEPQRLAAGGLMHGLLPTLDTSAFLLDRHDRLYGSPAVLQRAPAREIGGDGGGFDCFPTLESWKVM